MSDCCWMSAVCRQEHQTVFEAIGFRLEEERPDGTVCMIDEQASYANDSDLRALAGKGIPFHAENGPGGEYPSTNSTSTPGTSNDVGMR